ncbi:hypothetical protein VNI00_019000 [Paramarasmius palmivorus]|uniref:NACHT domain-containing protein n=1 Tax=Paramarasmius palmivorus TaxID=297713 RepID=A0AAW0AS02_9AGAR
MEVLRLNPNILHTSLENQFVKLVLEPYAQLSPGGQKAVPNLIVIDGLDECIDLESQRRLLHIIRDAITFSTPFPLIFLICSRPEPQISDELKDPGFSPYLQRLPISDTTIRLSGKLTTSDHDVEKYLVDEFTRLRQKLRALRNEDESWPGCDTIWDLVWRASGQFIFAVTVIKYIDTIDDLPQDRLNTILNIESGGIQESPYPELDLLYRQILLNCRKWNQVYPILRLLVTPKLENLYSPDWIHWRSPSIITRLFNLRDGEVEILLARLHSVIAISEDVNVDIHIPHASFTEFLLDRIRSREFHTPTYSRMEYCDLIAMMLLRTLSPFTFRYPPYCSSRQSFSAAFKEWRQNINAISEKDITRFSGEQWSEYCITISTPSAQLLAELGRFDPYPVAAMLVSTQALSGPSEWLSRWAQSMAWMKSLNESNLHKPLQRLESFFSDFCIAFCTKGIARSSVVPKIFTLEGSLACIGDEDVPRRLTHFVARHYEQWWAAQSSSRSYPLLFSPTTNLATSLPRDWIVTHVTKANGEILKRAYDIYSSLDQKGRKLFCEDVAYDSLETVSQSIVKADAMLEYKELIYKRRRDFSPLGDDLPVRPPFDATSASTPASPIKNEVDSVAHFPTIYGDPARSTGDLSVHTRISRRRRVKISFGTVLRLLKR